MALRSSNKGGVERRTRLRILDPELEGGGDNDTFADRFIHPLSLFYPCDLRKFTFTAMVARGPTSQWAVWTFPAQPWGLSEPGVCHNSGPRAFRPEKPKKCMHLSW